MTRITSRPGPMVKIFIDDTDNGGEKTRVCDPAPAACALPTSLSCLTRIHINLPSVQVFPKCLFKKKEALGSLGLEYIEGSRTMDTLRYGKTGSQLPFQFSFSDKANVKWVVEFLSRKIKIIIMYQNFDIWHCSALQLYTIY